MRILLINPPENFLMTAGDRPSLGIAYIAAVLEKDGHDVKIYDMAHYPSLKLEEELIKDNPSMIGITTTTALFNEAKNIAKRIKSALPNILLVSGGVHVSALPKEALNGGFDIAVVGEGEITMSELAEKVSKRKDDEFSQVKGIVFKKGGELVFTGNRDFIKNLDGLPLPARHLLPMREYDLKLEGRKATSIITSRGCAFNCAFCGIKRILGTFRANSPKRVVEEIEDIINNYGITAFYFQDGAFTTNKKRTIEICDIIMKKKLDIKWWIITRADLVDNDILNKLYEAGCVGISYGVESGDDEILKKCNKRMTVEQNKKAIEMTKKAGMKVKAYFMIGLPGDSYKSVNKTINFAKSLKVDGMDFYILSPMPGTDIWDNPSKFGLKTDIPKDWVDFYQLGKYKSVPIHIETEFLSKSDINKLFLKARNVLKKSKVGVND